MTPKEKTEKLKARVKELQETIDYRYNRIWELTTLIESSKGLLNKAKDQLDITLDKIIEARGDLKNH